MIVLDTNVISALMRKQPEKPVVSWLDAQPSASVWITAITVMEIRFGLQTMPKGRRQDALLRLFELLLKNMIEGRIASFDAGARNSCRGVDGPAKARGPAGGGARHRHRRDCSYQPCDAGEAEHTTFQGFATHRD